jgi:hypothetical protein
MRCKLCLLQVHKSAYGTSRQFAATQHLGPFRSEADINATGEGGREIFFHIIGLDPEMIP